MTSDAPDLDKLKRILILGPGVMGAGTAVACARAGFQVDIWGRSDESLERGARRVEKSIGTVSEMLGLTEEEVPLIAARIGYSTNLAEAAEGCDFVLESVAEDLALKCELLGIVDAAAPQHAILATQTSGLSVTELGRATARPGLALGTHFWNPPELMPLVEVVKGSETTEETLGRTRALIRRIGKVPVTVHKDVPGFIGNRMLHALWREAITIVERGIADPEDVDTVAKLTFGLRSPAIGPLENMDLVGLDLILSIHRYLLPELEHSEAPNRLLVDSVTNGDLGFKTEKGFYDWSHRDSAKVEAARNEEIARQLRRLQQTKVIP
jgi:3-hydroxybutyryl-CoA dehydrogenase